MKPKYMNQLIMFPFTSRSQVYLLISVSVFPSDEHHARPAHQTLLLRHRPGPGHRGDQGAFLSSEEVKTHPPEHQTVPKIALS